MSRWVKWLLGVVAALVVLVAAAAAALPYLVDTPRIQAYIAASATQTLGRPVKFSAVTLRLLPLLTGRVELGDIVLRRPAVTIIQASDGRLNISSLGATTEPRPAPPRPGRSTGGPAAASTVAVARVLVDGGTVTYVARAKGEGVSQYRLSDANVTLTGGGTQITFKGDTRLQPGDVRLTLSDGVVALTGGKSLTEASMRGKVAIDGKDVGPLAAAAIGPSPALGGGVKGTLALGGTVAAPTAAGEI